MAKTEQEELVELVGIGLDIEAFFSSTAGKKLLDRLEQQEALAIDQLVEADAENPKLIRTLQNRVKWARTFKGGLLEMIQEGDNAELQLKSPGDGEL